MKGTATFLLCFLTIYLQAQSFEDYITKGDQLYDETKYTESAEAYKQALQMQEGNASQYYNAACSWALSGDTIQSMQYLKKSAEKGWYRTKRKIIM